MIKPNFKIPDKVLKLILKYYKEDSLAFFYYYTHCIKVTELALKIATAKTTLSFDMGHIINGGMLHDIGIVKTNAHEIGCFGNFPYIAHTYLGRKILEENGFESLAPICERHIGLGLTIEDIITSNFPLPHYDMVPLSLEEKLICYADKFYSKNEKHLTKPKSLEKVRKKIRKYGDDKAEKFEELLVLFGYPF